MDTTSLPSLGEPLDAARPSSRRPADLDGAFGVLDAWIPGLLVGAIVLLVAAESFLRTFVGVTIAWRIEVTGLLFTWVGFYGAAASIRLGRAIAVDALHERLGPRTRRMLDALSHLVTFAVASLMCWALLLLSNQQGGFRSTLLRIPTRVRTWGIVGAFALVAVYSIRDLVRMAREEAS